MDSESLRRIVDEAGFIFRGRMLPHRAGEGPAIPAEAGETVATQIEEVLRSADALRGLAGQQAVVITKHAATLLQHQALIFFTECISLGQQLLVREIGHIEASAETSRQVAEAVREAEERPL